MSDILVKFLNLQPKQTKPIAELPARNGHLKTRTQMIGPYSDKLRNLEV